MSLTIKCESTTVDNRRQQVYNQQYKVHKNK